MSFIKYDPKPAPNAAFQGVEAPFESSSWLSQTFFSWATPLLRVAYSRPLEQDDLYELPPGFSGAETRELLERAYYSRRPFATRRRSGGPDYLALTPLGNLYTSMKMPQRPLWQALLITERYKMLIAFIMITVGYMTHSLQPLLTTRLIKDLTILSEENNSLNTNQAAFTGGLLVISAILVSEFSGSMLIQHSARLTYWIKSRFQAALVIMITAKSFRLSPSARTIMTNGRITNMTATDSTRIVSPWAGPFTCFLSGIVNSIACTCLLYYLLGPSTVVGLFCLILGVPVTRRLAAMTRDIDQQRESVTDERLRVIGEVLTSIRAIKIYAYELYLNQRIGGIRDEEMALLRKKVVRKIWGEVIGLGLPLLSGMLTIICYAMLGNKLEAATLAASWQAFHELKWSISEITKYIPALLDAWVAMGRLDAFFRADEQDYTLHIDSRAECAIHLEGDFWHARSARKELEEWDTPGTQDRQTDLEKTAPFGLKDISLRVPPGSLVVIYGRVGTGKSSLLLALLNELSCNEGSATFSGSVTYVPQHAWVTTGTIRDIITFKQPADQIDYQRLSDVIKACGLISDLELWAGGIMTEVGERGITLSGGQRQRLCLARAAYSRDPIVLLDDPLSALDAHVGQHVLQNCILSGPFADRTRVLVTHQVDVVDKANLVLLMDRGPDGNGRIVQQGPPEILLRDPGALRDMLGIDDRRDSSSSRRDSETLLKGKEERDAAEENPVHKAAEPLMLVEERRVRAISAGVYEQYRKAIASPTLLASALIAAISSNLIWLGVNMFLGAWINGAFGNWDQRVYAGAFAGLGVAYALTWGLWLWFAYMVGLRVSAKLFTMMWTNIIHSPMTWHDRTPTGRILARLSKDIASLDDELIGILVNIITRLVTWAMGMAIIAASFPIVIVLWCPLAGFVVSRLSMLAYSAVQSQVTELLNGITVIRLFGKQGEAETTISRLTDREQQTEIIRDAAYRWSAPRAFMASLIGHAMVGLCGLLRPHQFTPAMFASIYVYFALGISSFIGLTNDMSHFEQSMSNVERVLEYTNLQEEAQSP